MAQDWKSADLEVCLEGAEPMEGLRKMGTSRPSTSWKICLSLLAIGLCAAAAITINNQKQDTAVGSEDMRHTLRQISKQHKGSTAIHLEGEYNSTFSNTKVEWKDGQDQSFHAGGLKLVKNEIVIPRKGVYFVYSQVSFRINCRVSPDQAQSLETIQLSHAVMRTSRAFDDKRPLLKTMRSGCKQFISEEEDSGERWYSAINLGAVFSLEEGDQLYTLTESHLLPHVEGESGETFFGVFAL
ncbi:tumor necrosis factor-like [Clupea harengus]|uniref:Tumor necrosis factor n=1 Tax=Clupea harengus TaxID=7950 RepID=A0A6P8H3R4_CLUHA|nr:tumor necrosis factor-like [Clupea harengus]